MRRHEYFNDISRGLDGGLKFSTGISTACKLQSEIKSAANIICGYWKYIYFSYMFTKYSTFISLKYLQIVYIQFF